LKQQESNMKRKLIYVFAAASTLAAGAAMAQATIAVQVAPPAPIVESVPAPRDGFTWAPGHYVWSNGNYVWESGQWMADRPGYAWAPAHWVQRADGSWTLAGGAFVPSNEAVAIGMARDGDRDGIPDYMDDDKDNDGLPNRYDRHPNNPHRR
jgi:hypothetical protein